MSDKPHSSHVGKGNIFIPNILATVILLSEVLDFTLSLVTERHSQENLLIEKKGQLYNKLEIGGFGLMHGIKNFANLRGFYPPWSSQRGLLTSVKNHRDTHNSSHHTNNLVQ